MRLLRNTEKLGSLVAPSLQRGAAVRKGERVMSAINSIIVAMKNPKLMGCQQVLLHPDKDLSAILEYACGEANKIYNCATYYARQVFFKEHRYGGIGNGVGGIG